MSCRVPHKSSGQFFLCSFRLALLTFFSLCSAQDPLFSPGRRAWLASSRSGNQPWRRQHTSARSYHRYQPDYSKRFVDWEECQKDPRSRVWRVDFKKRKIGQLSATSRLVWANLAAFAAQVLRPSLTSWGMKLSDRIMKGEELYRLVTPIFLHGGLLHLMTNMISLQRTGGDVEKIFGSGRYVTTYIAAGIAGNYLSAMKSPNPSLGASGAVFGVFGAYFVFLNRNEWLLGSYGQAMTNTIIQTIGANIFLGMMNPVIDNWAHLGGALGGAAMAYLFGPRLFLSELPSGARVVIDQPLMRLPLSIESIPERMGDRVNDLVMRMQAGASKFGIHPNRPWLQVQEHPSRPIPIRVPTPNRSIKPQHP